MRRAIVWGDEGTLINAHDAFARLRSNLRDELADEMQAAVGEVQRALAGVGEAPTPGGGKWLHEATQALGVALT